MDWQAIGVSLRLAAWTTAALALVGTPIAYWTAFSRFRWKFWVEAVVALPLVLPPTVLGFYVLVALGPNSPVGGVYETLTGAVLPFSFEGLVVASTIYSLPFAVQPMRAAFGGVDARLIEASRCLGEGRWATFRRVILPLAWPGVVSGMTLSFAHTMGEFGVVLMVGGNLRGETRTAAISIYDDVQALDYASAGATSAVLLAFSFVALAVVYAGRRDGRGAWPGL